VSTGSATGIKRSGVSIVSAVSVYARAKGELSYPKKYRLTTRRASRLCLRVAVQRLV
jgi:hypothetical protein